MRSTFLRGLQADTRRGYSSSTMRPATRSVRTTQSQLGGWSKVCSSLFLRHFILISPQHQEWDGHITPAEHACVAVYYLLENGNVFISQKTTPPCPAGSRACSKSFANAGCDQKRAWSLSVQSSSAPLAARTVAAGMSFSSNLISWLRNHSSRN